MNDSILDQVRQTAADLLTVPLDQVTAASSPETLENWDSVQQLNLVLALESHFGLEFSPEDLDQMHSIGDISALIGTKLSPFEAPR
jgi:acyl carrier protein